MERNATLNVLNGMLLASLPLYALLLCTLDTTHTYSHKHTHHTSMYTLLVLVYNTTNPLVAYTNIFRIVIHTIAQQLTIVHSQSVGIHWNEHSMPAFLDHSIT